MQPSKLSIITATILSDDGSDGTNDPDAIAMMLLLNKDDNDRDDVDVVRRYLP